MTHAKVRDAGIDAFRFISVCCVILIHTCFYGQSRLDVFLDAAVRFAVPFFFIAAGYFLKDGPPMLGIWQKFIRIFPVFAFWAVVYLMVSGDYSILQEYPFYFIYTGTLVRPL